MDERVSYYQVYVQDYAAFRKLTNVELPEQVGFQIVLQFARENPAPIGQFEAAWDTQITPSVIEDFKKKHQSSKVFASIGGPSNPYSVRTPDINKWSRNAQLSLTGIINDYHLDGIDVHYHLFDPCADLRALEQLLGKLKEEKKIISLSAPNPRLNREYYIPLFNVVCNDSDRGTVLYQFQKKT